ncbi:AsnC family transcriptional regulator [Gleimia europaea]|uniref:AsnC family transcriptional regulator n=1 Tax=Gleimia europaea TaxID=66228 RepID=UPI00265A457B|nr:AsnC family transcriptional regulator [Gleimia europaea]MDK7142870.1 AsnC family transcriptional regulator [Gleimia europaea]
MDIDAEIALIRTVTFIDHLTDKGTLTPTEARSVLGVLEGKSNTVIGSLLLKVRLDKHQD